LLSTQASERSERPSDHERCTDDDGLETTVHLTKRLVQETARREYSERHASELSTALKESEQALRETRFECECYRQELDDVEQQLTALLKLSGLTLLYVGGRPPQIPQLKHMTERAPNPSSRRWGRAQLGADRPA